MPRQYRVVNDVCSLDSNSSEELYVNIPRPRHKRHGSVVSSHHHHVVREPAYGAPSLAVPVVDVGGRKRASSASGLPQPNIIINADGGSRNGSRERTRPRSRSRGRRFEDDDDMFEEVVERRGRAARSPSPYYHRDYETRKALERLSVYEAERAEEEAQERYKAEMEVRKAKEQLEHAEAEKKKKELAKKAVEDWQREEEAKKLKEKKEKEEMDKKVEEELRSRLVRSGRYSAAEIERIVQNGEPGDKKQENEIVLARSRPTHIKVHTKYLLPETLNMYQLPWAYDAHDNNYVIIKEYISDELQHELFSHTKELKSRKLIAAPVTKETTLKVNDRRRDKMYLVRKKDPSPARVVIRR